MYLLLRYPGGIIVEGVALAKGSNRMRVAAAGFPDTLELRRIGALWINAKHESVEFDFLMSDRYQAESVSSPKGACMTMATGG